MRYTDPMKTATIPSIRVEPELRERLESLLGEGETLSSFVEATVRSAVEYRQVQADFHSRGKQSSLHYEATGISYSTDEIVSELRRMTEVRRKELRAK
jgi:hypothetical protein